MSDEIDDQAVRGQLSPVEIRLDLNAERRAGLDLRPEDVTGRDRRDPVFLRQSDCLGSLTGPWRTEEHEIEQLAQYLHGKPIGSL